MSASLRGLKINNHFLVAGVCSILMLSTPVIAQTSKIDSLLLQRVDLISQPNTPLDDYLLQLAEKTNTNFIVDATDFPPGTVVHPYLSGPAAVAGMAGPKSDRWQPTLLNRLTDVAAQYPLSQLRQGERVFLFWSEPDVVEMGRLITQSDEFSPRFNSTDYKTAQSQLATYLKEKHNWKDGDSQPDATIRFDEIPADLRKILLQIVCSQVSGSIESGGVSITSRVEDGKAEKTATASVIFKAPEAAWFSDEFWKSASIKGYAQSEKMTTQKANYLLLGGPVSEQDPRILFAPIGRLDSVHKQ